MEDFQEDLFQAKINALAEQKANELVKERFRDPEYLMRELAERNQQLEIAEQKNKELEVPAKKWSEFMDSDGYISVATIAEKLRIEYLTPSGRVETMGRNKFCQMLVHDRVLISESGGYRISKRWYAHAKEVYKIDASNRKRLSVKFSSDGLDRLIEKYGDDNRTWISVRTSKGYGIKAL